MLHLEQELGLKIENMTKPLEIPKSKPQEVFIKNVVMRDGKDYNLKWSKPMYEVETDVGTYIAPTIRKQQEKIQNGNYVDWDELIGDRIEVFTNFDGEHYWINSLESNNNLSVDITNMMPLDEAIKKGLPPLKCFVYKLEVGGENYIGFTSQEPKDRLEGHLEAAKNDSRQKVHKELRRYGFMHTFDVLSEHPNEVLALVEEIKAIKKYGAELNVSIGGEGNNYNVVEDYNHLKEKVFFVQDNSALKQKEAKVRDKVKKQKEVTQKFSVRDKKAWETASKIYPEITNLVARLTKLNVEVGNSFKQQLIVEKSFASANEIADTLTANFVKEILEHDEELVAIALDGIETEDGFAIDLIDAIDALGIASKEDILRKLALNYSEFGRLNYEKYGFRALLPEGIETVNEEAKRIKKEKRQEKEKQKKINQLEAAQLKIDLENQKRLEKADAKRRKQNEVFRRHEERQRKAEKLGAIIVYSFVAILACLPLFAIIFWIVQYLE